MKPSLRKIAFVVGSLGALSASTALVHAAQIDTQTDAGASQAMVTNTKPQVSEAATNGAALHDSLDALREKYGDEGLNGMTVQIVNGKFVIMSKSIDPEHLDAERPSCV
jgi:hypothetical protein